MVGPDRVRQHAAAVERLRESYAAIPDDQPVRLAKRTSNLFRRRASAPSVGLDVAGLDGVVDVDPVARTADVQGMCTYEHLVAAALPHGLMPLVVPQLKTITLGGAVSGLGIESSSYRNGLPHESVLEMDILTGDGTIVTCAPEGPHADLFAAFPNSFGSLGYAVRLRIELERVSPYVALRHIRFEDLKALADAIETVCRDSAWDGEAVDFVDGVVFEPAEAYLTLGRWTANLPDSGLLTTSDYTGQEIYYRSIRERSRDVLTVHDYLWRWDTDWFWCSATFGAQHRLMRQAWPRRLRRSDVYHRLVGFENRFGFYARLQHMRGRPEVERVIQDVEIPVERVAEFLHWFDDNVGMRPVWLCPIALRHGTRAREWPLYPLVPGQLYVNVGFWGTVAIELGRADGDVNRMVERAVADHDGHKSLYSDVFYDRETFEATYGGKAYDAVKDEYDPGHRLTGFFEKVVRHL
ncbi:MAG: FAD-binding oxidoreductase [Nocardioidaceae bacterium]